MDIDNEKALFRSIGFYGRYLTIMYDGTKIELSSIQFQVEL